MRSRERERELGRGERVLPGLWRLRLPIPFPGVPHGNAWAIADGDGIVLVDTGIHDEGSMAQLERALAQVGLSLDQVTRLVITHTHIDHFGQAAPIVQRTGAEMWMHPAYEVAYAHYRAGEDDLAHRVEVGRQSGVPETMLEQYVQAALDGPRYYAGLAEPDHPLVDGVGIDTDLGRWEVHETPGHALSHVSLHQPDQRLIITGDHLLGRVSAMYLEHGDDPDPVVSYVRSLDRVAALRARLALSGHGRPFLDVPGHIAATRELLAGRLAATLEAIAGAPATVAEIGPRVHGENSQRHPILLLSQTRVFLEHLEATGRARRESDGTLERWSAVQRPPPQP
jgi:glyoxylase-like metal-dependent hydrolase (beta-lactamase superfamily II)